MKKKTLIPLALGITLIVAGCGSNFNEALDADREAREKMNSALSLMAEVEVLVEEGTEQALEIAESKKSGALDAYKIAVENWDKVDEIYRQKIADDPGNSDLLNNLANSLYFRNKSGFDFDMEEAKSLLNRAIEIQDRPIYQRNLELIISLSEDEETIEMVNTNRRLLDAIQALE